MRVNPIGTIEVLTGAHSHGQGHETTFAQIVNERSASASTTSRSSMATPTRCSSAWAPTARAPRSACRRSSRRSTRSRPRPRRSPRTCSKPSEGDIDIENGELEGRRHRQAEELHRGRARRLHRAQPAARHGAGAEGGRLLRPDQLHLPGRAPISARSRSIRRPARPRSSSSSPPTTSATSSTRSSSRGRSTAASPMASARRCWRTPTTTRNRPARQRLATWTTPCRAPTTCRRASVDTP